MKKLKTLFMTINKYPDFIEFGVPENKDEYDEMHKLRYETYSRHNYIDSEKYTSEREQDEYDELSETSHIIAKTPDKIIGTVRIIFSSPLPIHKAFSFSDPEEMKSVSESKKCEIGRLIIVPPDRGRGIYLPRGLVMLFLLQCIITIAEERDVSAGYAFVKETLQEKMEHRKMPFNRVDEYSETYSKDNTLYNYFTQENDPVVPIYFFLDDFKKYTGRILNNPLLFKKKDNRSVVLRTFSYQLLKKINLL